jgi:hypothetical protein
MAAVRRNGSEWVLRFAPVTRIDPVKLLSALSRWEGRTVLVAGETPSLRLALIRDENAFDAVGELLVAVAGCMAGSDDGPAAVSAG